MTIESDIFAELTPNFDQLQAYGFHLVDQQFRYQTELGGQAFRAELTVSTAGQVSGQLFDLAFGDEYVNFRVHEPGEFATKVKAEYVALLRQIAARCFDFNPLAVAKAWVIPANPKQFDLVRAFAKSKRLMWHQTTTIQAGDLVYIYVGQPLSAIMYQCLVIQANLPARHVAQQATKRVHPEMMLELLAQFDATDYPLQRLKQYEVRTVRGQRYLPAALNQRILTDQRKK